MIGGIAHNLKTPIMSIAGASEGILDLIKEYETSIGDAEVTIEDHHEIAGEMKEWIDKIKTHLSYMSDVITAIKGQAVAFGDQTSTDFSINELLKMVNILMKHELKNAIINLNIQSKISQSTSIKGNINSLVQVVNNIISNAIQAYQSQGKSNENIDLTVYKDNQKLILKIQDYAGGLPEKVQKSLFKEMITTKGKNGSGLGLFMSYSNIKAHFNGSLKYKTKQGQGTIFYIEIPLIKDR
ncbi:MAG: HAMP domain-containing sensor histidine kinase [Clostridia bacterium]|nr:HAMP domain-containing sensor histidine kinase [Clostridia bacterium]